MTNTALVSCEWLYQHLITKNQVILDATFFLPRQQRNARDEYLHHIPGALFFDIDEIADKENDLAHTLPKAKQFSEAVGKMGIQRNTRVILYDNNHFFAAARVWWMFRVFGHDAVRVLDGGLKRWIQLDFPLTTAQLSPDKETYQVCYHPVLTCDLTQMMQIQHDVSRQILDARSPESFLGLRSLTAHDLHPGHIPKSINVPYAGLTETDQHTLLPNEQLLCLFDDAGVNLSQPMVTTCGSGVSAAVLLLALYQMGLSEIPMYDGSWAEWGRQTYTPKHTL